MDTYIQNSANDDDYPNVIMRPDGQFQLDVTESVTSDDISSNLDKGSKIFNRNGVMENLSIPSNINISVPKTEIPQIILHSYA